MFSGICDERLWGTRPLCSDASLRWHLPYDKALEEQEGWSPTGCSGGYREVERNGRGGFCNVSWLSGTAGCVVSATARARGIHGIRPIAACWDLRTPRVHAAFSVAGTGTTGTTVLAPPADIVVGPERDRPHHPSGQQAFLLLTTPTPTPEVLLCPPPPDGGLSLLSPFADSHSHLASSTQGPAPLCTQTLLSRARSAGDNGGPGPSWLHPHPQVCRTLNAGAHWGSGHLCPLPLGTVVSAMKQDDVLPFRGDRMTSQIAHSCSQNPV